MLSIRVMVDGIASSFIPVALKLYGLKVASFAGKTTFSKKLPLSTLIVPNTLGGKPVIGIGSGTFASSQSEPITDPLDALRECNLRFDMKHTSFGNCFQSGW